MHDAVIIGGGICGCSLLYSLSRYRLDVLLVEKENDVSVGTTKANSAIVHAGYDPKPGTYMAKTNVEGNALIRQLCSDLDVHYKNCGSLVIGFDENDRAAINKLYDRGVQNGVPGLRIVEHAELHELEPALSADALFALYAPSAGIVCPWELAIAQAECAVQGGAKIQFNTEVTGIEAREGGGFIVETSQGPVETRFLINAAGTSTDKIEQMLGQYTHSIKHSRGEYYLLDNTEGLLVRHVVFQCPTPQGKGVLVAPTVHGNIIAGPNSDPVEGDDLRTTEEGLSYVRRLAVKSVPSINFRESIRNFAGVRANTEFDEFIVGPSKEYPAFINMAGIKSPGLSSAPAIAEDVVKLLAEGGLKLEKNPSFVSRRKVLRFKALNEQERAEAIRKNPAYGTIVCRCMSITEGEIIDALHRPIAPRSVDAVKRRCDPGMGRCQGGFCGSRVMAIISRELGLPQEDIPQDRVGMDIIIGETKRAEGRAGA
ncbi:NAD(P)/FAD-dependent oxidoreductase [Treponema sp. OttesenSCG-928-L16]|nr:NAD(P)/FAD-dependent oxidoreductase [Treponema sp. OttesenSCG-928-L16]